MKELYLNADGTFGGVLFVPQPVKGEARCGINVWDGYRVEYRTEADLWTAFDHGLSLGDCRYNRADLPWLVEWAKDTNVSYRDIVQPAPRNGKELWKRNSDWMTGTMPTE